MNHMAEVAKLLGYVLLGIAGFVLTISGLGCNTWQFWVISLCVIFGVNLTSYD